MPILGVSKPVTLRDLSDPDDPTIKPFPLKLVSQKSGQRTYRHTHTDHHLHKVSSDT